MRKFASVVAAVALAASAIAAVPALGDERSDLVDQQQEQKAEKERLQSEMEGIDVNLQEAYLKLEETRGKIPAAEAAVQSAEADLAAAVRELEANTALLDAAQGQLEEIKAQIKDNEANADATRKSLGELARATYRGDTMPSTMEMLVGSATAEDFANAYRAQSAVSRSQSASLALFQQKAAQEKNREARQNAVEDQIEELKTKSEELVDAQSTKKAEADARKAELVNLEASLVSQSEDFEDQKASYQASLATLETQSEQTAQRIAEIDAENQRKLEAERARAKAQANAPAQPAPNTSAQAGGAWLKPPVPAPLYVTSPFGMRVYPFGGTWMHNGVDLRSQCGEAQTAPADGVVSAVIPAAGNGTHGNQIYINHGVVGGNSYVTVTNHLSAFNVSVGQAVKQGDVIGWTGQTGLVTACHVHFEVWKNGAVVDPMNFGSFTQRWS
ncbi:M23 family metallopeptidase [Trueperella sp.]|uniref:murein hydrolase activator EnvC family protein n=1 Tax=Trueperella sp. TaxID=2699835 RepID=UPI0022EAF447|nr:M23 family metallopeptidase [Trueperella sp.]